MHATQLTCPHCGSSLSFGSTITAGTMVECLICMRTFAAAPVVSTSSTPAPVMTKSKPAAAKTPIPKAPAPAKAETTGPSLRKAHTANQTGGKGLLVGGAIALLFIVGVGGFAIWKMASGNGDPAPNPGKPGDKLVAANPPDAGVKPPSPLNDAPKDVGGDIGGPKIVPPKAIDDSGAPKKVTPDGDKKIPSPPPPPPPPGKDSNQDSPEKIVIPKKPFQPAVKLVGVDQTAINSAIDRGVAYLKRTQRPDGAWQENQAVPSAALAGLTLLECNVPANDPAVQKVAQLVRKHHAHDTRTYALSMTILFLDRLGDPNDRPIIQGAAMRLMSGQINAGGWTYGCDALHTGEMSNLHAFLHANKNLRVYNPLGTAPQGKAGTSKLSEAMLAKYFSAGGLPGPFVPPPPVLPASPLNPTEPAPKPPAGLVGLGTLSARLQSLPVVQYQGAPKNLMPKPGFGSISDNSNTQFALLALWAARRHDVPVDIPVLIANQRFVHSQNQDGSWYYVSGMPGKPNSIPAMTCAGLLGLAMGHATAPEFLKFDAKNPKASVVKPAVDDPRVKAALQFLSQHIGQPHADPNQAKQGLYNVYFLWSVERVAVLYQVARIGGKDWYSWGAQNLVQNQGPAGDWGGGGGFEGASPPISTSLALLFLRRSNLVQDLSEELRFHSGIRDVD